MRWNNALDVLLHEDRELFNFVARINYTFAGHFHASRRLGNLAQGWQQVAHHQDTEPSKRG